MLNKEKYHAILKSIMERVKSKEVFDDTEVSKIAASIIENSKLGRQEATALLNLYHEAYGYRLLSIALDVLINVDATENSAPQGGIQ